MTVSQEGSSFEDVLSINTCIPANSTRRMFCNSILHSVKLRKVQLRIDFESDNIYIRIAIYVFGVKR
jgi:hypothetical protein